MEKCINIDISIKLKPNEIHMSIIDLLNERYANKIFKKYFIKKVNSVSTRSGGKLLNDGSILYKISADRVVLDPEIGEKYQVLITSTNKMGALHKNELVTIFVPLQYYNGYSPEVDSTFNIKIIGKRIEDSIVCVGTIES